MDLGAAIRPSVIASAWSSMGMELLSFPQSNLLLVSNRSRSGSSSFPPLFKSFFGFHFEPRRTLVAIDESYCSDTATQISTTKNCHLRQYLCISSQNIEGSKGTARGRIILVDNK
ncbi:hypothetical protein POM88_009257 [Heracleum sosnowskyi]|uniref:Uncharacterized protein n=1 Tax=Heracleum sosnowskyi TaxID=360622 RepID=A0AAD8N7B4_9APIA|nr:hypothetical protein POM88_009257 [Heracleum sosnowskyi]